MGGEPTGGVSDEPRRCGDSGGVTKAGRPCRASLNLSAVNGRCLFHDDARRAEARAIRVAGAKAKAVKIRKEKAALPENCPRAPHTLQDAERIAAWITRATLIREIDVRVSEAGTKAVRQFQLTVEKRTLQDRVRELERAVKAATK